jgi:hypothetical protein
MLGLCCCSTASECAHLMHDGILFVLVRTGWLSRCFLPVDCAQPATAASMGTLFSCVATDAAYPDTNIQPPPLHTAAADDSTQLSSFLTSCTPAEERKVREEIEASDRRLIVKRIEKIQVRTVL